MRGRVVGLAVFVLTLFGFSLPGVAAIRATGESAPLGFIPLSNLRDTQATFYLEVGQRFWDRVPHPVLPLAERGDIPSLLLQSWLSKLDRKVAPVFDVCLQPDVLEFTLVRWPPRPGLGEDRVVWLLGLTLPDAESVAGKVDSIRQEFGVPPEDVFGRTRNSRRYFTLIQPTGNLHIIPGEAQLFLSPNLFLVQSILDQGSPPPEPPGEVREATDAVIGWRIPSPSPLTEVPSDSPYFPLARLFVDNQFELSLQAEEHGLGITFRLGEAGSVNASTESVAFNPNLLASVPSDAGLLLVSGGIPSATTAEVDDSEVLSPWFRRPFALGLATGGEGGPPPEGWRLEGAFKALPEINAASEEEALLEVEDLATGATGEWAFEQIEDRVRFSSDGQLAPEVPTSEVFQKRAERFLEGAFLGGLLMPQFLAAPFAWQAALAAPQEPGSELRPYGLEKETSPIEFNIGRDAEGLKIRLFTEKPASYLLLLSSLLFVLDVEYAGEWEELSSAWDGYNAQEIPPPAEVLDDGPDWPARLKGVPSAP